MKIIRVADVNNARQVAEALQEAADEVLNHSTLESLTRNRYNTQAYQYVHPDDSSPAVASAALVVGGLGEERYLTSLFVTVKLPGSYHYMPRGHYVPFTVIRRLRVRLRGLPHGPYSFGDDYLNHEARVHIHLPTQTFREYPAALVELA